MPSSPASSSSSPLAARCLGCGGEFETEQVVLLGQTFPAERYCELCRATEEVVDEQRRADGSGWARDRIDNLGNQREQERRLVIVTTIHEWRELASRVGGPTASRLRRLTREVHVDARQDYREQHAA